jgi:sialate O-acetylesterase
LRLALGQIDDHDRTFVNGFLVGETEGYNRERVYTIPQEVNSRQTLTVAVQIRDTGGSGGFHGAADSMSVGIDAGDSLSLIGEWKFKTSTRLSELPAPPTAPGFDGPNNPTALYNGMIHPLVPYGIRGAIWYQGEANVNRAYQYRELFPLLIHDWRAKWDSEFSFYWVQLANFMAPANSPQASAWAELREAQSVTLREPKTGQAVIIDIGEADDIHPRNKQDVGRRLANLALRRDYGRDVQDSGPIYRAMRIDGNKIRLDFEHAEGLTTANGKPLTQFAIAGANRKFFWAQATIDGEHVVVSADNVLQPLAVRYAWSDNPVGCNLTNSSGLPASPFRTDDWPESTFNNR